MLNLDPPLPALFAMNDVMAFGAIVAIRERGLRGLEGTAGVGFVDNRLAPFAYPPLTMNEGAKRGKCSCSSSGRKNSARNTFDWIRHWLYASHAARRSNNRCLL